MIDGVAVLGLIPARGGSKGVPGKNIRVLGGKPLIAWTIEAARASSYIDRVIVSTDSARIAAVSRDFGGEVPFMRPPELAADATPGIDVVRHAVQQLPHFGVIVLLQPTSPLRSVADIDAALDLWTEHRTPVVAVTETVKSPFWTFTVAPSGALASLFPVEDIPQNRQDAPRTYTVNGAVYVAASRHLVEGGGFLSPATRPYIMPAERSVDIDSELDFAYTEFLLKYRGTTRTVGRDDPL